MSMKLVWHGYCLQNIFQFYKFWVFVTLGSIWNALKIKLATIGDLIYFYKSG